MFAAPFSSIDFASVGGGVVLTGGEWDSCYESGSLEASTGVCAPHVYSPTLQLLFINQSINHSCNG